jgi:hypothetical protein
MDDSTPTTTVNPTDLETGSSPQQSSSSSTSLQIPIGKMTEPERKEAERTENKEEALEVGELERLLRDWTHVYDDQLDQALK